MSTLFHNAVWKEDNKKNNKKKSSCESKHKAYQCYTVCTMGKIKWVLTGTDNLLNLDKGNINFLCKLSHCLIRVLVGEGVDINLDP